MKKMNGTITISRQSDGLIHVAIMDSDSFTYVCEAVISKEVYAEVVTGMGYRPCDLEYNDSPNIGKIREHKAVVVPQPKNSYDMKEDDIMEYLLSIPEIADLINDGWIASCKDLINGNKKDVGFVRYVERVD